MKSVADDVRGRFDTATGEGTSNTLTQKYATFSQGTDTGEYVECMPKDSRSQAQEPKLRNNPSIVCAQTIY
jgi:hypothetical protein